MCYLIVTVYKKASRCRYGHNFYFPFTAAPIIVFFIYIVGFIITFIKKDDTEKQEKETRKINLSTLTSNMILISLNIIYLVFSIIQFRYLFMNAGKTLDFDYATYARTGFFQLMFVSFINLVLLKITRESKGKLIQILKILLIIFTMIIVISAMVTIM